MEIQAAKTLALRLMDEFDLLPDWNFRWDHAKKRFGQCRFQQKIIQLSKPLTKLNSRQQVEDTIRHEIAHAKDAETRGRSDHSACWKQWAIRCGAKPVRCYSTSDVVTPEAPLYTYCPNCTTFFPRYRKLKQGRIYACGFCSKGFNPDYAVIPNISLSKKKSLEAGKIQWHDLRQSSVTARYLEKTGSNPLFLQRFKKRVSYSDCSGRNYQDRIPP